MTFKPTHRHADGGEYELVETGKAKFDEDEGWWNAVFYRAADGHLYCTGEQRWMRRFTEIK